MDALSSVKKMCKKMCRHATHDRSRTRKEHAFVLKACGVGNHEFSQPASSILLTFLVDSRQYVNLGGLLVCFFVHVCPDGTMKPCLALKETLA